MSESIHDGYLPLWNPYINFGIPEYGDMSGGYWSPITWLVASTVGYTAYTFTIELLAYILIAGIGMYQLTSIWQMSRQVRIISAVAFMCCGYMTGHLQHFNWINGAAFFTWCFWSYTLLLKRLSLKNTIQTAFFFYMLIASAHPGISIAAIYFFAVYMLFHFFQNSDYLSMGARVRKYSFAHFFLLIGFGLIAAGMITGYLDMLPYFGRGEKIKLTDALLEPTTAVSWISTLLPFATVKNQLLYNNDIAMRNSYFSLTLFLFFWMALLQKKNNLQKFFFFTGLFFVLLSSGGIYKTIAYKFIPLIGYVRLNGEFRIFAIFCFIIIAAIELDKFIQQKKKFEGIIKWIYYSTEIIIVTAIAVGMYKGVANKESFIYQLKDIITASTAAAKLKFLIDSISFYDTLWMQGFVQLFVLWGIKWCLRLQHWPLLKKIVVADMILACLFNIPFTGVGKASVAQVQAVLNKSPKGIPIPILQPLEKNDTLNNDIRIMVGDWTMYNKQIGTRDEVIYPIVLKNAKAYFEKDEITKKENHFDKPYIFMLSASNMPPSIQSFSPQAIEINAVSDTATTLVLQQNFYPHWYYQNGAEKKLVNQYEINFISVPLNKGANNICISFEPTWVKRAMLFSAVVFVIFCLLLLFWEIKRLFLSSQEKPLRP